MLVHDCLIDNTLLNSAMLFRVGVGPLRPNGSEARFGCNSGDSEQDIMTDVPQVFLNWLDFLCDPSGIAFDFKIILLLNYRSQLSGYLAPLDLGQVCVSKRKMVHNNLATVLERYLVSRWSHRQGFVNGRSVDAYNKTSNSSSEKVDERCTILLMTVNDHLWIDVSEEIVTCSLIREENIHIKIGNGNDVAEFFHLGSRIITGAWARDIHEGILRQWIEDSTSYALTWQLTEHVVKHIFGEHQLLKSQLKALSNSGNNEMKK